MSTPKPPPPAEPLKAEERSCLLRAARRRLLELQDEMTRLQHLPARYAAAPIEATQSEMDCLSRGVKWLWEQATSSA
jgi:hypothetical protein